MIPFRRRQVRVDLGYGPAEHWVEAEAVDSRTTKGLFGGEQHDLLVQLPSGERIWVHSWEEDN